MFPATYRQIVTVRFSRDFREAAEIVEVPFPQPAPDQVVLRVIYAGVNASDVWATMGAYNPGQQPPFGLGSETIGEVVAVGEAVESPTVGALVAVSDAGIGYREYAATRAKFCIPVPMATPEILSIVVSGLTASIGLEQAGEMKGGETVLITAAAGGTGQYAVQLAKLAGCHVIATCGSDDKADFLRTLGADRVVNYHRDSLAVVLPVEYPPGIDIVYESVGGTLFDAAVDNLARHGRLIIIGFVSEYKDEPERIDAPRIYHKLLRKSASVRGFFLPHFRRNMPEHIARLAELMQSGKLRVSIDPTPFHGIDSVIDAVEYLQSGSSMGKVVVKIAGD